MTPLLVGAVLLAAPQAADEAADWKAARAAFRGNLAAVRTAVFRVAGRRSWFTRDPADATRLIPMQGDETIRCVADYAGASVRFDRTGSEAMAGKDGLGQPTVASRPVGGKYFHTPTTLAYRFAGGNDIHVNKFDKTERPRWVHYFDVRVMPLLEVASWDNDMGEADKADAVFIEGWPTATRKEGVLDVFTKRTVVAPNTPPVVQEVHCDPTRGHMPVGYSVWMTQTAGGAERLVPYTTVRTAWDRRGGAWVPTESHITYHEQGTGRDINRYDLTYTWESVNEPVPSAAFTIQDFAADKRTMVFDRRSGGKPVLSTLGGKPVRSQSGEELAAAGVPVVPRTIDGREVMVYDTAAANPARPGGWPWWVVAAAVVLAVNAVVVAAVLVSRRRRAG